MRLLPKGTGKPGARIFATVGFRSPLQITIPLGSLEGTLTRKG